MKHTAWICALALPLLAGCGSRGLLNRLPPVEDPLNAATVTIYREPALAGSPVTMTFLLDGRRVYGLGMGDRQTFKLDPKAYSFGFRLGLNECRRVVWLEPNQEYLFRLAPLCEIRGRYE